MSRAMVSVVCALAASALWSCAPSTTRQVETVAPALSPGGVRLLSWSGDVMGRVVITYSPRGIMVEPGAFTAVENELERAHATMPQRPGTCELELQEAPGSVSIVQQPNPGNGYACRIQIVCQSDALERFNFNLWFADRAVGQ